ncbi:UDP-glycosyltransferase 89B1-like [Carica papaya]|uniref:UDP-glycosyltransferase 89B1-like n=1 Tax=Carica papaya TaxID=3649 RepID=UPI000B8D0493|nr:UDP-glycosyltransferase 89B1-like [Carica papaya]
MSNAGAHISLYPFPTSGHIIPLLDLADRLLTHGLNVTVFITPKNRALLDPLLSAHSSSPSLHPLLLPSPEISPSFSPAKRLVSMLRTLRDLHYPLLLDWFQSHPSPPVAIVSDFFLGWTQELAAKLGVRRIVFSPSGALAASVYQALWHDQPSIDEHSQISFPGIPNSPKYYWYQISHTYRDLTRGDPDWEFSKENTKFNLLSWGYVFNSFSEIERVYLDHLKQKMGHDRVWAVGPLLPSDVNIAPTNRGGTSSVAVDTVLTWLDERGDNTVIYICFGSRTVLTSKQVEVLAAALEKSQVHFIWCVALQPADGDGAMPEGFEQRLAGKGLLIKGWAPQVAILRHRAVGSFLTHCGWNSTLEGISAGVVMLTWPMGADQFTNANLLADELEVAIRVGESTQIIAESNELARVLTESLDRNRTEKIRVEKLRNTAVRAVNGGSSENELSQFVKKINELRVAKG